MIQTLYWGTLLFSGLTAFSRKIQNTKVLKWLCVAVTLCGIVLVISANREGNDIINYVNNYNATKTFDREPLYTLLTIMGDAMGMNFYQFHAFIAALGYLLIVLTLKKYTGNIQFILFFYCWHLLLMDSMQVRNFLAVCILIYSVQFLQDIRQKKNLICYCVGIFLAANIHTAFVIYYILMLLLIKGRKTFIRALFAVGVILTVMTGLNGNKIPFIEQLVSLLMSDVSRAESYFSLRTNLGFLPPMILYVVALVGIWLVKEQEDTALANNNEIRFVNIVWGINLCFVVVVPMMMMSLTFYRLIRNLLYLNFAVYSIGWFRQRKVKKRLLLLLLVCGLCSGWAIFDFAIYADYEAILEPVFSGKWFWE